MAVDIAGLNQAIDNVRNTLKDALLAMDVWDAGTGLSLADHNGQPTATALFNLITGDVVSILRDSGYPGLNKYYLLDLEDAKTVVISVHTDTLLSGMLLDTSKTSLGVLVSVVIPRLHGDIAASVS